MPKEIVFAKQPILDSNEQLVGYELLFRQEIDHSDPKANRYATSALLSAFLSSGYRQVLNGGKGFVNVDELFIKSGSIEILPKEDFVIEVLEDVEPLYVAERLEHYKKEGYIIALDDFVANEKSFEKYLDYFYLFDIVKFDIRDPKVDKKRLPEYVNTLKHFGIQSLAEKVETKEEYEWCKQIGFELFQGYFFVEPEESSQKTLLPNKRKLLELWAMSEDEFDLIVEKLRNDPELSFVIIKLVNSSFFALRKKISSVREALVYLGLRNFKKWILLTLYAQKGDNVTTNPKLALAKSRANFLSLAARKWGFDEDKAHLTGVLSLLEDIFGATKEEIEKQLPFVDEDVVDALVTGDNFYGKLLKIAQRIEQGDFVGWAELAKSLGKTPKEIAELYSEALLM